MAILHPSGAALTPTSAFSATATWTNITGYSITFTPQSASSVLLLIAGVPWTLSGTDGSVNTRFHDGTSAIGPVCPSAYSDNTDEGSHGMTVYAVTGYSGSTTFTLQAEERAGNMTVDTARNGVFAIIELESTEATLHNATGVPLTSADSSDGTMNDVAGMSVTFTPASADSVNLMIGNVPTQDGSDVSAIYEFATGGTALGKGRVTEWWDLTNEGDGGAAQLLAVTGISTNTAFSLQWQTLGSGVSIDTGLNRYFQVVELLNATLTEDQATGGDASPASYAAVPGLTISPTIDSTDSVVLLIATSSLRVDNAGGVDTTIDYRFADDGTREGPELTLAYRDAENEASCHPMAWAKTGISGSQTFTLHWQERTGGDLSTSSQIIQAIDIKAAGDVVRTVPQADLAIDMKTPTIAGATWKAALDTDIADVALDAQCNIVFSVVHDGEAEANWAPQLEARVDGGAWFDVTAASTNVRATDETRIIDGTDVPDLIGTGGTYLDTNAGFDDVDGIAGGANLDWPDGFAAGPNDRVNLQYSITFRSADLSGGEDIDLRIKGLDVYDGAGYARATIEVVGGNLVANPPQGDMTIDMKTPTVTIDVIRTPPQADLVIDAKTPAATEQWLRTVPQTDLTLDFKTPVVNEAFYRTPPQADLVIDLKTPAKAIDLARVPPQADLVLDFKTPAVAIAWFRLVPQTDLVLDFKTPTVNETHVKLVPQADLLFDLKTPAQTVSLIRLVPQADLVIDLKTPDLFIEMFRTVPKLDLLIDLKTPFVGGNTQRAVPQANLVIDTKTPAVLIDWIRSPGKLDLVIDLKTPSLVTAFYRTVPQTDLVLSFAAPDVLIEFIRQIPKLDLVIDMKTPAADDGTAHVGDGLSAWIKRRRDELK